MEKNESKSVLNFVGKATIIHVVTYFAFGLLLAIIENREEVYATELAFLMRPTTDILVVAGPLFQLIRGPIIALVIYPFYETIFNKKRGWLYLWGLFIGLATLATVGPSIGSIEGAVYTVVPSKFHLLAFPEAILQTLAFSLLLYFWEQRKGNRRISVVFGVLFVIVLLITSMGVIFYGQS